MKEFSNEELKRLGFLQVLSKSSTNRCKQNFIFGLFLFPACLTATIAVLSSIIFNKAEDFGGLSIGYVALVICVILVIIFFREMLKAHKGWKDSLAQQQAVRNMASNYDGNLIVVSEQSVMIVPATLDSNVTSDDLRPFGGDWLARLDVQKHQEVIETGIFWADMAIERLDMEVDGQEEIKEKLQQFIIEDQK